MAASSRSRSLLRASTAPLSVSRARAVRAAVASARASTSAMARCSRSFSPPCASTRLVSDSSAWAARRSLRSARFSISLDRLLKPAVVAARIDKVGKRFERLGGAALAALGAPLDIADRVLDADARARGFGFARLRALDALFDARHGLLQRVGFGGIGFDIAARRAAGRGLRAARPRARRGAGGVIRRARRFVRRVRGGPRAARGFRARTAPCAPGGRCALLWLRDARAH